MTPPQNTGIKSIDDKNYEDYLKVLQIYRPDLFIDEENNNNYVIPTPKTETEIIEDVLPPDIFTPKTEEFLPDLMPPQKTGIKSVDDKNYEDYLKVLQFTDQTCLLMKRTTTAILYWCQKLKLLKLKMLYLQHH